MKADFGGHLALSGNLYPLKAGKQQFCSTVSSDIPQYGSDIDELLTQMIKCDIFHNLVSRDSFDKCPGYSLKTC